MRRRQGGLKRIGRDTVCRMRVWEAVPLGNLCRKPKIKLLEACTAHVISHDEVDI